jgi:hypothetical protein
LTGYDAIALADGLKAYLDMEFHRYCDREKALRRWEPPKIGPTLLKEGMDSDYQIDANTSWSIGSIESFVGFLRRWGFVCRIDPIVNVANCQRGQI